MTHKVRLIQTGLLGVALAWPASAGAGDKWWGCGCKSWFHIDNCATIPPGAQPAPVGTYVNQFIKVQDTNAEADDFVLYKHMWYMGGTTLGPLGRYQLDLISKRLGSTPFPVVIATSKNDELDEARRETVIRHLAMRGINDPSRVIVAFPVAEGLTGEEAVIIAARYLRGGHFGGFGGIGNAIPGVSGVPGYPSGLPGVFSGTFGGFR